MEQLGRCNAGNYRANKEVIGKNMTNKKTISIHTDWTGSSGPSSWEAQYQIIRGVDAIFVAISSRSEIEVVVAKLDDPNGSGRKVFFVSCPNFGIALSSVSSLTETSWIAERLIVQNMPESAALTLTQVLQDVGDF